MGAGNGGDGCVYEAVVALAGIAHGTPVFGGRKEGYAASGSGRARDGRCWGL